MKTRILKLAALGLVLSVCSVLVTERGRTQTPSPKAATVEQVFKNIQVFRGMPQSQLYPAMRLMATSLGFGCGDCHVFKDGFVDGPADNKPEKRTARAMIRMVVEINKNYANGYPMVSCYTCHRGQRTPVALPSLPLLNVSTRSGVPGAENSSAIITNPSASKPTPAALSSVDDVLDKYTNAIGGRTVVEQVRSCIIKGTTTTSAGEPVAYELESAAPDKAREIFTIDKIVYERVVNGARGWFKNDEGVHEFTGQQILDQKLLSPLFAILELRNQYATMRVSGRDVIDNREMVVVRAIRPDDKSEQLYFDAESGLLRRRITYIQSMIGLIPDQLDFADYRDVGGIRLPFKITMSNLDARGLPISRVFSEIKFNLPISDSTFNKPTVAGTVTR
jgi:hypothetical protein